MLVCLGEAALSIHHIRPLSCTFAASRCGLDAQAWSESRCADLLKSAYTAEDLAAGAPLPFDLKRAHALYVALFGTLDEVIKDKHLLVFPACALSRLPFQVLITRPPDPSLQGEKALRSAAWLGRRQPITVVPSVLSLDLLRKFANRGRATKAFVGFGNPLLDGDPDVPWQAARAKQAREKQDCTKLSPLKNARFERRSATLLAAGPARLAGVANLKFQVALPETADELCGVAHRLGVPAGEIRLGARATEREIMAMSRSGRLADYRIVHFATHGALAGQVAGAAEPGLILTPPDVASDEDDGYLAASEIAGLKLNADWVILSACEIASGTQGVGAIRGARLAKQGLGEVRGTHASFSAGSAGGTAKGQGYSSSPARILGLPTDTRTVAVRGVRPAITARSCLTPCHPGGHPLPSQQVGSGG